MASTKKEPQTGRADDDFLQALRNTDNTPSDSEQNADGIAPSKQGEQSKVAITFKVNKDTAKAWKQLCLDFDMTLTAAIKTAMKRYSKDLRSGRTE